MERNALRAGLANRAEEWRWCSLWQRQQRESLPKWILSDWPVSEPMDWVQEVNRVETEAELEAVRRSVQRGQPYGEADWSKRAAKRMGLESTFRSRGRPRKKASPSPGKGSEHLFFPDLNHAAAGGL